MTKAFWLSSRANEGEQLIFFQIINRPVAYYFAFFLHPCNACIVFRNFSSSFLFVEGNNHRKGVSRVPERQNLNKFPFSTMILYNFLCNHITDDFSTVSYESVFMDIWSVFFVITRQGEENLIQRESFSYNYSKRALCDYIY